MWNSHACAAVHAVNGDALMPPVQAGPWGVAALLLATGDALAARFGAVAVKGELSGLSRPASGHVYFSLKDSDGAAALLRCAMFRRAASLVDFAPTEGQQVELRGRLGVYDSRGELQLVVESMQRVGAGTLYEEFLRLRTRLQALGLFDALRKRPLAAFPAVLGVVTSLGAAALHDVLITLQRRSPQVRVVVYPSLVQGADAPAALVAAITRAGQRREVDTLLLVRGGGALEDLWAFNDERVVRAVAACPMPVVCGVGHETDITLADMAADLRAPTPTAAAELAAPLQAEALAQLGAAAVSLQRALQRTLQTQAQRLDTAALRLGQPSRKLLAQQQRDHKTAAVAALITAGRKASRWSSLTAPEQDHVEHQLSEAEVRMRLLPVRGADLAADWASHHLATMKRNSANFSFQADHDLGVLEDAMVAWHRSPRRAKKLFAQDLAAWKYDDVADEDVLITKQREWAAAQDTATGLGTATVSNTFATPVTTP